MDTKLIIFHCAHDQAILELQQQGINLPSEEQIKTQMNEYYVLIQKNN